MKALLLVDVQNDFMPGGALPVANGGEIIPVINRLLEKNFDLVVATKDWHPKDHSSFIAHDGNDSGVWPVHCVEGTGGAEFAPGWDSSTVDKIFHKGIKREVDSYSTFFDNAQESSTGLDAFLKTQGVDTIYIAGLATDYCVKYSVLDAVSLGFKLFVVKDGCRGVNLQPGDSERALQEMESVGATLISSDEVV